MKRTSLTLRLIVRSTLGLALFSALPLPAPKAVSIQGALQSNNQPISQESTQSQEQNTSSAQALAEASRLSLTVVKLYNEGKYDEALPSAKRALELRERALGPDHEMVQSALLNLAEIYTAKKKYGEAQKLVERLLKTYEKTVGPEDAGAAIFQDKLAFLTYVQGDFSKSEAAYKRALAIREKVFGQNHTEFATSLYMLAEFYRFTGKFDKAQPLYERSTILRGKLLGREHPDYLKAKERYFCVALVTGQEQKIKDIEKILGDTLGTKARGVTEDAILNGRAISLPKPSYSDEARRDRAQGRVIIKVTIDELGNVIDASDMCGGNPLLVKPSLQSARAARFTPTKLSGQPVKVTGVITYNFVAR
jgi:TonB family protein